MTEFPQHPPTPPGGPWPPAAAQPPVAAQPRAGGGVPNQPTVLELAGVESLADEFVFRRHMARHAASQTLSLQRTEHYTRQIRTYVAVWFWLGIIGVAITVILMIVAAAGTSSFSP